MYEHICTRIKRGRARACSRHVQSIGTRMIRVFLFLTLGLTAATFRCTGMTVANLDCEHQENPLGVDVPQPRLSWVLQSSQRGDRQTAYQILAASSEALLNNDPRE